MSPSERATVLVVDDEPDVADAYAAQLRGEYEVLTAHSGEAGLAKLDPDVDVVLLDRRMPDVRGADVLDEIRDRDLEARVAMVTAVDPDFEIIDMPFDDYVVKPVSRSELIDTIERLLNCAAYEERFREFYALASKHAALSANKPTAELRSSEEFQDLEERLEQLRTELDDIAERFDGEDYAAVLREVDGRALSPLDE
ncbi:HalX domain-containing protein [Halomicrobium salinisoli]|uniref:HalX domain-containing protein n=1 Tax=Halomicrobium salinisoli TaxID=2878391 RepID=UPI001CF05234|nr:HalX domain-containing protein [Halomicrobium salinisoli]